MEDKQLNDFNWWRPSRALNAYIASELQRYKDTVRFGAKRGGPRTPSRTTDAKPWLCVCWICTLLYVALKIGRARVPPFCPTGLNAFLFSPWCLCFRSRLPLPEWCRLIPPWTPDEGQWPWSRGRESRSPPKTDWPRRSNPGVPANEKRIKRLNKQLKQWASNVKRMLTHNNGNEFEGR